MAINVNPGDPHYPDGGHSLWEEEAVRNQPSYPNRPKPMTNAVCYHRTKNVMEKAPAADVVPIPKEYVAHTDYDGEHYLIHITAPITKEQFEAMGVGGENMWDVLCGGAHNG